MFMSSCKYLYSIQKIGRDFLFFPNFEKLLMSYMLSRFITCKKNFYIWPWTANANIVKKDEKFIYLIYWSYNSSINFELNPLLIQYGRKNDADPHPSDWIKPNYQCWNRKIGLWKTNQIELRKIQQYFSVNG